MDQQRSQVTISALANPTQTVLSAAGVLVRDDPKPCRKITPAPELSAVPDAGNDGGCRNRANARNLLQALYAFILFGMCMKLLIHRAYGGITPRGRAEPRSVSAACFLTVCSERVGNVTFGGKPCGCSALRVI